MKRAIWILAVTALSATFVASSALAQSSGSFSAAVDNTQCTINSGTGVFVNGVGTVFPISFNTINVKVSSGSGTTLVVTPSLVTGLFTDNQISTKNPSSTQNVGVQITVEVDPPAGVAANSIHIAPDTTGDPEATCSAANPNGKISCVIYDQRFIQITSQVLASLAECTALATTSNPTCFDLTESTLSAHSFNFYVQVPQTGTYAFNVNAQMFVGSANTAGAGSVAACAGPGTVTVQQVKNFSFNSTVGF